MIFLRWAPVPGTHMITERLRSLAYLDYSNIGAPAVQRRWCAINVALSVAEYARLLIEDITMDGRESKSSKGIERNRPQQ